MLSMAALSKQLWVPLWSLEPRAGALREHPGLQCGSKCTAAMQGSLFEVHSSCTASCLFLILVKARLCFF